MLSLATCLLAGVFAEAALGGQLSSRATYKVVETFLPPDYWQELAPAPADHIIHLDIGLKQGQIEELERHTWEVSDPDHHRYGQHLTAAEVEALVKPSDEAIELVHEWLFENGFEPHELEYSAAMDFITIRIPVSRAEELLDTKYSIWEHDDGSRLVRTPSWSLPEHLHGHVDSMQPTNSWLRAMPKAKLYRFAGTLGSDVSFPQFAEDEELTIKKACNFNQITPTCLHVLYGTRGYKVSSSKSLVGLNDFLNETNNRSDTKLWLETLLPKAVSEADSFKFHVINGGNTNQSQLTPAQLAAGLELEGNLDVQTIIGLDYPMPLIAYTTGGSPPFTPDDFTPTDTNEPYATWLKNILKQTTIPQTISTSYADDEQTVPFSYATKVCNQLMQLSARGVSLFHGSGDEGVGGNGTCFSNTGSKQREFIASFPSTCQYVTSVGGTKDYPPVAAFDPRNGFASGGGFSNYFPQPSFQSAAVNKYIKKLGNSFDGLYNKTGRAYPDLSAQSVSFVVAWNGTFVLLDGTSASTPTVAGVFALVNDALMANDLSPLGWLNPFLYKKGYQGFTDVVSGSAIGCNHLGFPAGIGWDAVTGWGTPSFKEILPLAGVSS